jgi:predicted transcriptional regulator
MPDKNKREALLEDLKNVWHLMDDGLNPEQIAIVLDMDISTVNVLVNSLIETNKIVARTGKSMDFILDQYRLSLDI